MFIAEPISTSSTSVGLKRCVFVRWWETTSSPKLDEKSTDTIGDFAWWYVKWKSTKTAVKLSFTFHRAKPSNNSRPAIVATISDEPGSVEIVKQKTRRGAPSRWEYRDYEIESAKPYRYTVYDPDGELLDTYMSLDEAADAIDMSLDEAADAIELLDEAIEERS